MQHGESDERAEEAVVVVGVAPSLLVHEVRVRVRVRVRVSYP